MTRQAVVNEVAGTIHAALIANAGTLSWLELASQVVSKLDALKVLIIPEELGGTNLMDFSPTARDRNDLNPPTDPQVQIRMQLRDTIPLAGKIEEPEEDAENLAPDRPPDGTRREWRALREEMRRLGLTEVLIRASGSGDEGQIDEVATTPSHIELPSDLRDRFDELFWDINAVYHDGWWNNEGGHGNMAFRSDGHIYWDHYNTIEESEHNPYHFSIDAAPEADDDPEDEPEGPHD